MILYNVTVSIEESAAEEWLHWMTTVHVPDVMNTGLFIDSKICRIEAFEQGGLSYSIQYLAPTREHYQRYQAEHAPRLQAEHTQKYQGKFAAFRTLLEVLDHQTRTI